MLLLKSLKLWGIEAIFQSNFGPKCIGQAHLHKMMKTIPANIYGVIFQDKIYVFWHAFPNPKTGTDTKTYRQWCKNKNIQYESTL